MAVSWRTSVSQKMLCWNPYFYSVFLDALFLAKLSKREILDSHPKKKKRLITEKLFFFLFLIFLLLSFFLFCFCFCFFGGFKVQVRWPKGPPHSALNPPCLDFCLFAFCCFLFFLLFFPFFASTVSPLKRAFFKFLSVSLCSSAFLGLPLFQFLCLCLSLSLSMSLSLSCYFLSFFLVVFLSCFLLVPCFCLFLSFSFFFAFVSCKEQHQNIQLQSLFSSIISLFFGFLSCFLFQIPFSYLCFFLILSCVFC